MKKNKILYLVLGLGIGIVFSGIVHSFFPNTKIIDMTENEITERARLLGMVSISEIKDKDLEKQVINEENEENENLENEDLDNQEDTKIDFVGEGEEEVKPSSGQVEEVEILEVDQDTPQKEDYIEVIINKGENSYDVARILFDLGLIDDKDYFLNRSFELKVDKDFRYGKFKIRKGAGFEEIVEIITDLPKN